MVCSRDAANEVCLSEKLDTPTIKNKYKELCVKNYCVGFSPPLAVSKFAFNQSIAVSTVLIS